MLEWKEPKKCIHKIYSQGNTGDGVLFSAVADMWAYSFSKKGLHHSNFLWKLGSFTEHQFYRTMLRNWFWFPVKYSMHYLPYQWWINSVIAWRYNITTVSIIILVLYYYYYYYCYYYYHYYYFFLTLTCFDCCYYRHFFC